MHNRHVRVRRAVPSASVLIALLGSLIAVDAGVAAARHDHASTAAATEPLTATIPSTPSAARSPTVAPLAHRVRADLLLTASRAVTPSQLHVIRRLSGARDIEVVDYAPVALEAGRAVALGVNVSSFRRFTPAGTAEVDRLWQSVANGDAAVAFDVARSLDVPLGGTVDIGRAQRQPIRVGAYATTGLPGVGVVVAHRSAARLGLVHRAGVVVHLPHITNAPTTASVLRRHLPSTIHVATVRTFVISHSTHAWVAPATGRVTSEFGPRASPLDPNRPDFHPGIDIGAALGAPVWAASTGTVLYAGPSKGFGNEIILLHAGDVTTVYGHMSRLLVTAGTAVRAGQPIALVGSEGESTGPHLHFEVHVRQHPVDPLGWLRAHGVPITG